MKSPFIASPGWMLNKNGREGLQRSSRLLLILCLLSFSPAVACLFFFSLYFGNLRGFLPRYGFGFARMGFLVRGGSIGLDWADLGFDLVGICGVIRLGFRNREDLGSIWYWIWVVVRDRGICCRWGFRFGNTFGILGFGQKLGIRVSIFRIWVGFASGNRVGVLRWVHNRKMMA